MRSLVSDCAEGRASSHQPIDNRTLRAFAETSRAVGLTVSLAERLPNVSGQGGLLLVDHSGSHSGMTLRMGMRE